MVSFWEKREIVWRPPENSCFIALQIGKDRNSLRSRMPWSLVEQVSLDAQMNARISWLIYSVRFSSGDQVPLESVFLGHGCTVGPDFLSHP